MGIHEFTGKFFLILLIIVWEQAPIHYVAFTTVSSHENHDVTSQQFSSKTCGFLHSADSLQQGDMVNFSGPNFNCNIDQRHLGFNTSYVVGTGGPHDPCSVIAELSTFNREGLESLRNLPSGEILIGPNVVLLVLLAVMAASTA